jgi:hypothetical protein
MTIAPIDIRIYRRPIGVSLPESPMPQSNTLIPQPPCFLCDRPHHHTPYAIGYLTAGSPVMEEKIFIICFDCADSDEALKAKITAKVSEPAAAEPTADISQQPAEAEDKDPATPWTAKAARDWVKPAASPPAH